MSTFADLGVSEAAVRALSKRGITSPFAVQRLVIPDVLAGRDVLVKSPTGSGKTLAFGVPLLDNPDAFGARPFALVLAPTRELASQIVDEIASVASARSLTVAAVHGGVGLHAQAQRARRADVLVATPGRLLDLLERGDISLGSVRVFVLDEADRMLDMGFKPDVDRIVRLTPRDRQTLLFSATLDGEVGVVAREYTRDARRHERTPAPEKQADVEHRFVRVAHDDKVAALVDQLGDPDRGRTLVFVRTKRGADRLVKRLRSHQVDAVAMHGDKSQGQRERALARFEDGKVAALVATDVAARGIDVEGITHVINYDTPEDSDAYTHRIGRTGRAGRQGTGVSFVLADQAEDVRRMAGSLGLVREFEVAHGGRPQARSTRPAQERNRRRRRKGAGRA